MVTLALRPEGKQRLRSIHGSGLFQLT